jgi:hypothetical protein
MNIRFDSSSIFAVSFIKKEVFSSITQQQKIILMITSLAIGILAIVCVVSRYYFKAKKDGVETASNDDQKKIDSVLKNDTRNSEVSQAKEQEKKEDLLQGDALIHPDTRHLDEPKQEEVERDTKTSSLNENSDTFTGKGKKTLTDGEIYEGDFINGVLISGVKTYPDGFVEKGIFKDDELVKGKKIFDDSKEKGEFNDRQLVKGKRIFCNGERQEGEFNNGYLVNGKMTNPNEEKREGKFENDRLVEGTKTCAPGGMTKTEEGKFDAWEMLQGQGKVTYPNGKVYGGLFENGIPINMPDSFFDDDEQAETQSKT